MDIGYTPSEQTPMGPHRGLPSRGAGVLINHRDVRLFEHAVQGFVRTNGRRTKGIHCGHIPPPENEADGPLWSKGDWRMRLRVTYKRHDPEILMGKRVVQSHGCPIFHTSGVCLSHGYLKGGHFPHLLSAIYPATTAISLFTLLKTPYRILMSCLGDANDTNFYSASSASGELELYPFTEPLPDGWCAVEWPSPPTNPQATVSHGKYLGNSFIEWHLTCESPEPATSATSCTTNIDGYGQPSYTEEHWPATGYQAEPHHPGFLGWDDSFTCTADSETSTAAQTSTSGKHLRCLRISENLSTHLLQTVPFDYFEGNQSWPSTSMSHTVSAVIQSTRCAHIDTFSTGRPTLSAQNPSLGENRAGSSGAAQTIQNILCSHERVRERRGGTINPDSLAYPIC